MRSTTSPGFHDEARRRWFAVHPRGPIPYDPRGALARSERVARDAIASVDSTPTGPTNQAPGGADTTSRRNKRRVGGPLPQPTPASDHAGLQPGGTTARWDSVPVGRVAVVARGRGRRGRRWWACEQIKSGWHEDQQRESDRYERGQCEVRLCRPPNRSLQAGRA